MFAPEHFENPLGWYGQSFGLVFPPWHPHRGKMFYQTRRDKHRASPREFRVVNATTAHDFILEVPGQARLFVLLDVARETHIAATAYRDVQRWTIATGICQRICKAHVFDETFGVNS